MTFRFLPFFSLLLCCCLISGSHGLRKEPTHDDQSYYQTLQLTSLLPSSVCNNIPTAKASNRKVSLQVLNRHGPCNKNKNSEALATSHILSQDQARVDSIQSRLAYDSGRTAFDDSKAKLPAKSGTSLGTGNYIVTVGLGTPKRDLTLIFDTGSDFTWTQCEPCVGHCYSQQEPTFDPSKSTTYSNVSCSSNLCSQLSSTTGTQPICASTTCVYGIKYGDSSFSVGYFGKEKLTVTSTDVFNDFYFGCGQNNRGLFGGSAGLIGLGRDKLSIVSQTAQKYGKFFSYCLPLPSSTNGYLAFGNEGVSSSVQYTPFVNGKPLFYYIDITGISVGGRQLQISASAFKTAGTIIDSGTVITRLPPAVYSALSTTFKQQMTKYPSAPGISILDTCYDLSNYTTVTIPKISFLFSGNVKIDIVSYGVLYAVKPTQICLAFAGNSDASDVGIFGNVQQQTLEVVYDVAGGKLGFAPGGC